ncbi:MAG: hypothetical protein AAFX87_09290, partial [Bacteroidota bacterium]
TKKDVKNQVFKLLTPFFKELGFKAYKGKDEFLKETDFGFHQVLFMLSDYEPEFRINFTLGIRLDEVENIATKFLQMTEEGKLKTCTSMVNFGDLKGENGLEYKVFSEQDVEQSIELFKKFIRQEGLNYFDQYNDISKLDEAINADPNKPTIHKGPEFIRPIYSLTLARLNQNPDYENLVEAYKENFEGVIPRYLEQYNKLVEHLKTV